MEINSNNVQTKQAAYKTFILSEAFSLKRDFYKISLFVEVLLVFIIFNLLTKGTFMSARNLSNLLMQGCTCSVIAITMMLVIVSKNADLSAGLAVGFLGMVAAKLQIGLNMGAAATIIITLICGLMIGLWHGFWIGYKHLPAFIVTYATQLLFKGGTLLVGGGANVGPVTKNFEILGKGYLPDIQAGIFNMPSLIVLGVTVVAYIAFMMQGRRRKIKEGVLVYSNRIFAGQILGSVLVIGLVASVMILYKGFTYGFLLLVILGVLFSFIVDNTKFGRYVFAIGGNIEAARMSGINIEWTTMLIYIAHSVVTAVAAIVYLGRIGQATTQAGTGFEFIAITGCVVGGTSILGGSGTVLGAIIGTMLMAALDNGMSLMNLGTTYQYIVKGLILMLAVAMDVMSKSSKGGN